LNREGLIRALRKYARKKGLVFVLDTKKGSGSHYRLRVGSRVTTVQKELNPGRIERLLKQLDIDPDDL
jgi:mRNA interferase HicA